MNSNIKKKVNNHIKDLKINGITYIHNAFTAKECKFYINRFENLLKKFEKKYKRLGDKCQVIQNYFLYDKLLVNLIYHKKIDQILKKAIDENYVLINSSLTNRVLRKSESKKKLHLGDLGTSWHHDSRIIGQKRLDKGFSFIAVMMFNDFVKNNGSTLYIPKSHLVRDKKPIRHYNYKCEQIIAKAGTIAIIDTGLWHKASDNLSKKNRWSLFCYYGPWFMKPYYNFPEMLGNNFKRKINYKLQKLLHYHSTPPKNELDRVLTLV